jgi:hypothetical protein
MMAALLLLVFASSAFAGAGIEPPPPGAVITGPEIWGVVVMNCGGSILATVRVKRVVDCNTETEAKVDPAWPASDCPATAAAVEGQSLAPVGTSFFGIPGTAFINKVKNFKIDGNVRSFDAQFKFWTNP